MSEFRGWLIDFAYLFFKKLTLEVYFFSLIQCGASSIVQNVYSRRWEDSSSLVLNNHERWESQEGLPYQTVWLLKLRNKKKVLRKWLCSWAFCNYLTSPLGESPTFWDFKLLSEPFHSCLLNTSYTEGSVLDRGVVRNMKEEILWGVNSTESSSILNMLKRSLKKLMLWKREL